MSLRAYAEPVTPRDTEPHWRWEGPAWACLAATPASDFERRDSDHDRLRRYRLVAALSEALKK